MGKIDSTGGTDDTQTDFEALGGRAQVNPPRGVWGRWFIPEATDRFNFRGRQRLTWGMGRTTVGLMVWGWKKTYSPGNSARQEAWTLNPHDARQFR